jgi:hypothetical protein
MLGTDEVIEVRHAGEALTIARERECTAFVLAWVRFGKEKEAHYVRINGEWGSYKAISGSWVPVDSKGIMV